LSACPAEAAFFDRFRFLAVAWTSPTGGTLRGAAARRTQ